MTDQTKRVKPPGEMTPVPTHVLLAIAAVLAPYVAAVLARSTPQTADVYTSRDGRRPHGYTRRRFAAHCRKIPTAWLEGKDWNVPQADFWTHARRRPSIRPVVVASAAPANDDLDVDALLAGAGLRSTRRAS
ncbi:MAG: hypothetical protein U0270_07710 [Labilithrix sp.]